MANKDECISIEDATAKLNVSRNTLYGYINHLGIQRVKFPFDRKTYILKSEAERLKEHIERVRQ